MHKVAVFGGTGYAGVELIRLLLGCTAFELTHVYASERTTRQPLAELHPAFTGSSLYVEPWQAEVSAMGDCELAFLALPHEASAALAPELAEAGLAVFDLSGAFRLSSPAAMADWYGFNHPVPQLLGQTPYMLAPDWPALADCRAGIYAIPGCYPTAATLSLLPLLHAELLDPAEIPVIQGVSGASGAGRQSKLSLSFCELSFRPYGIGTHRHTPEISQNLAREVLFTPHVGPWVRGLITTSTVRLSRSLAQTELTDLYKQYYRSSNFIHWRHEPPAVNDVQHTPYAHLHAATTGCHVVAIGALDNLLKGAASQALEAANKVFDLPPEHGLEAWV